MFKVLRKELWSDEQTNSQKDEPEYKGDLLRHYNLRDLYDNVCYGQNQWDPPRKVGKANYFSYHNIAGDGHLRCDPEEESNKYDLAPMGEVHKSMQVVKLRPFGTKELEQAF